MRGFTLRQAGPSLELRWSSPEKRADGLPLDGPLTYAILARAEERAALGADAGARASASYAGGGATSAAAGFLRDARVIAQVLEEDGAHGRRQHSPVGTPAGSAVPPAGAAGPPEASPPEPARPEGGEFTARLGAESFPGVSLLNVRLAFAVVVVDPRGRRSRPGAILEIDPDAELPPPAAFSATGAPDGVRLSWRLPTLSGPAAVNIYRKPAAEARRFPDRPVAGSPFQAENALDSSARMGEAYVYEARLVALGQGKGLRESLPVSVTIDYADRFPPGPPSLLTAAAVSMGVADADEDATATPAPAIRLAWSPPLEADLSGYRIYRAEGQGEFLLKGQVAAAETAWEDTQVAGGRLYRYAVSAIDSADPPNESERSASAEIGPLDAEGPKQ